MKNILLLLSILFLGTSCETTNTESKMTVDPLEIIRSHQIQMNPIQK